MAQSYGLGRGLSSLIPQKNKKKKKPNKEVFSSSDFIRQNYSKDSVSSQSKKISDDLDNFSQEDMFMEKEKNQIMEIDINKIVANPYQPRSAFDQNKLTELANSIKEHGIIQPLVVVKKGNKYELVAGERRWRAAQLVDLKKVPVVMRKDFDNEKEKLELAVVENIQRHDLNPIEEAKAYNNLAQQFKLSQDEIAKKMGKSRSVIANKIRLLSLPIQAQNALIENKISEGHAKVILTLENLEKQLALLDLIVTQKLTVREAENKAKKISGKIQKNRVKEFDPELEEISQKLSEFLDTKVEIKKEGTKGKIVVEYYSEEDLDNIIRKFLSKE